MNDFEAYLNHYFKLYVLVSFLPSFYSLVSHTSSFHQMIMQLQMHSLQGTGRGEAKLHLITISNFMSLFTSFLPSFSNTSVFHYIDSSRSLINMLIQLLRTYQRSRDFLVHITKQLCVCKLTKKKPTKWVLSSLSKSLVWLLTSLFIVITLSTTVGN